MLLLTWLTLVLGIPLSKAQVAAIHTTPVSVCAESGVHRLRAVVGACAVQTASTHTHDARLVARVEMALVGGVVQASVSRKECFIRNVRMLDLLDLLADQLVERGNSLRDVTNVTLAKVHLTE